jgi:hypothetical protein
VSCGRVNRSIALALVAAMACLGCWSFQGGTDYRATSASTRPFGSDAILRVNEAGIAWGNGQLAERVQSELLRSGLFERVHFPVEPPDPPEVVIEVEALGELDEAITWAVFASAVVGYFYFVPALFVPVFEDYAVTCEIRVREGGKTIRSFRVASEANVVHALFANPNQFVTEARGKVFADLAGQIAAGVAEGRPRQP